MYLFENHSIISDSGEVENLLNFDKFPVLENAKLEDIFLLESLDEISRDKLFKTYDYFGLKVPRVSQILKECIHKEYLTNWAARLGMKDYLAESRKATTIGSRVHELIEHYLLYGEDLDIGYKISPMYGKYIYTAYENFKSWILYMNSLGYFVEEIIAIEKVAVCPYYGGTIDCVLRINGKIYIVDFKTSKQISWEYIVQTCSYMWMVNNGYCPDIPHIDGIGIIRIDKETKNKFEDLFLNEHIPYQREIINQYYVGFNALLSCFYNNINMKYIYSNYKKMYDITNTIEDRRLS